MVSEEDSFSSLDQLMVEIARTKQAPESKEKAKQLAKNFFDLNRLYGSAGQEEKKKILLTKANLLRFIYPNDYSQRLVQMKDISSASQEIGFGRLYRKLEDELIPLCKERADSERVLSVERQTNKPRKRRPKDRQKYKKTPKEPLHNRLSRTAFDLSLVGAGLFFIGLGFGAEYIGNNWVEELNKAKDLSAMKQLSNYALAYTMVYGGFVLGKAVGPLSSLIGAGSMAHGFYKRVFSR